MREAYCCSGVLSLQMPAACVHGRGTKLTGLAMSISDMTGHLGAAYTGYTANPSSVIP